MEENIENIPRDDTPHEVKKTNISLRMMCVFSFIILIPLFLLFSRNIFLKPVQQVRTAPTPDKPQISTNPLLTPQITNIPDEIEYSIAGVPIPTMPPILYTKDFANQKIAYPPNWNSNFALPSQFILVEAYAGIGLDEKTKTWVARFLYKGNEQQVLKDLVTFYGSKGWKNTVTVNGNTLLAWYMSPDEKMRCNVLIQYEGNNKTSARIQLTGI